MNYPSSNTWGVESAPLGTTNVTTLTEVNGFQTLANGGVYQQGYLIDSITDSTGKEIYKHKEAPVQVYSKATASIMNDLMRSVINEQHTTPFKTILSGVNYQLSTADWVGKTGTTDNYADNWLIVSTPSITLGTWTGRDDNKPMNDGAGNRTATYMAYLAGRIYQVNPNVFGENEEFELSDDVKQIKVSDFTGLKPGKVSHDGTNYQVPSGEATSLWAKDGPGDNTYEFGIGGTDDDYKTYWNTRNKVNAKNKEDKEDEETKTDD